MEAPYRVAPEFSFSHAVVHLYSILSDTWTMVLKSQQNCCSFDVATQYQWLLVRLFSWQGDNCKAIHDSTLHLALTWMRSREAFSYKFNWNAVVNTQETCMEPHTSFRNIFLLSVQASYCCPLCMVSSDPCFSLKCVGRIQITIQVNANWVSSTTLTHIVKLISIHQAPSLFHLTRYIICIVMWTFRL